MIVGEAFATFFGTGAWGSQCWVCVCFGHSISGRQAYDGYCVRQNDRGNISERERAALGRSLAECLVWMVGRMAVEFVGCLETDD